MLIFHFFILVYKRIDKGVCGSESNHENTLKLVFATGL